MGKVLKFVGGAVLIASAFILNPALGGGILKTAMITAGLGLASSVLPSGIRAKQGIETNIADPLASLPVVYGKAKVGLRLVDVREDPTTGNKELWIVGALCHGSQGGGGILSIDEVFFNGKLAINAAGEVQDPFVGKAFYAKLVGTDAQNWSTTSVNGNTLNGKFPTAWPTTSMGKGVAGLILRLTYDQEVFGSGIPQVTAVVRGNLVTDVRTGGTAYSTNPALCLHDYLRSTRYGMRLPSTEVDGGTAGGFAAMANYYDEDVTVTGPGTTQDRFACNGWLDTAAQPAENIRQLLTSCRGNLVYTGGLFKLFTRRSVSPTSFALTEADNIVGELRYMVPGIRETANVTRASYLAAQDTDSEVPWAADQVVYPRPTDTNDFLSEDNGFEVMRELELPMTTNKYTAEQIACVELQESRDLLTVELTATEAALQLEVGDVVPVTHSSPGWTAKPFWVDALVLDPASGLVQLALHEYNESAFSLPGQGTFEPAPNTDLPDPSVALPPTNVSISCDESTAARLPDGRYANRILVEWTEPADPFLNHYLIFAGKVGGEINTYGPALLGDTFLFVAPVPSDETWQVQMVAVNQLGIISALTPSSPLTLALPNLNVETSGANLVLNGDGQQGALGSAAPSWVGGNGSTDVTTANDQVKFSDRSLKINNTGTAVHTYRGQVLLPDCVLGKVYRLSGWVYQGALTGSGTYGAGFLLYISGAGAFRVLEVVAPKSNFAAGATGNEIFVGLTRTTADETWHFVTATITISTAGTGDLIVAVSQGWTGNTAAGASWYDGLRVEEVDPQQDGRWRPMVEQGNKGSLQTSTTPPLTSTNPVNIAKITIAAHSVQYHFGTVSYNSGEINGLGQNQLHYVYADDPDYQGGAVTYASSQTRATAVNTKGRYLIGTIITALNGGSPTTGDFGAAGGQITLVAP